MPREFKVSAVLAVIASGFVGLLLLVPLPAAAIPETGFSVSACADVNVDPGVAAPPPAPFPPPRCFKPFVPLSGSVIPASPPPTQNPFLTPPVMPDNKFPWLVVWVGFPI